MRLALERFTSVATWPFSEPASLLADDFLRGQFPRELYELLPKFIHTERDANRMLKFLFPLGS